MPPRPTRRRFLATAAAGLACWSCTGPAGGKVTGQAVPKLAAYDDLMTRFMREHKPPGAALAVTYHGRLVYARGFGHADLEKQEPVQPAALFRIASVSKPFTATAVMRLVEQGRLKLDDRVFPILKLEPHLERGAHVDPRLHDIRVHHCLQHTAGWDRDKSFDPMSAETAEQVVQGAKGPVAHSSQADHPIHDGQALGFRSGHRLRLLELRLLRAGPGHRSDFGKAIPRFVNHQILAPLGIRHMRLGKNLFRDRAAGEVKYYDAKKRTGRAISGPKIGKQVPLPVRRRVHRNDGCQRRLDRLGSGSGPLRRRSGRSAKMPHPERGQHSGHACAAARTGWPRTEGQAEAELLRLRLGRSAGRQGNRESTRSGTAACSPAVRRCWFAAKTASTGRSCSTATPTRRARNSRA